MGKRGAALGVAVAVAATLLAGCTSSGDADKTSSGDKPAGSAPTPGGVLVEQTVDVPNRDGETAHGGTMTVILRSVTATEGTTIVTWAMRWDDPDAPDDAVLAVDDVIRHDDYATLLDGAALKMYYPLCPGGDWHAAACDAKSKLEHHGQKKSIVNHQTAEAWAVFPNLEEGTKTVDLTLPGGLPAFSALPVTWA